MQISKMAKFHAYYIYTTPEKLPLPAHALML